MKKTLSILLATILLLASTTLLFGCSKEADYTLSVGTAITDAKDKLSVSATVAAVVVDADGKIVICRLDSVDVTTTVEDGAVKSAVADKTKYEKKDAYGMVEYGGAANEWYKQAEFFENHVIGKTVDEVSAIKTGDAELTAGCTIDVADFVKAIVNAMKLERKVSFTSVKDMKLGLGLNAKVENNKGAAKFVFDTAAIVSVEGNTVAAITDSAEPTVTVAEDGKPESISYKGTKLELGDAYGMVAYGGATLEWYAQAQNFANTAVGKATTALSELPVENVSGCTMSADPMKAALVKAGTNVR